MRCPLLRSWTVDLYLFQFSKFLCQIKLKLTHMCYICIKILIDLPGCCSKTCNSRYIICTGTHSFLLTSS